ncbi:hypothetical protein [Acetomicrobium sp.]|uniref:hypothetical protein n=1 Tax=Acetomicrobium sp. TaxID=1872099 RepID=UPI002B25DE93|nr:hypothetical protein [Acetomicrobium sp.]
MNECIGIDVGKQELVAFDGNRHYTFSNEEGLQALRQFLISRGLSFIPGKGDLKTGRGDNRRRRTKRDA